MAKKDKALKAAEADRVARVSAARSALGVLAAAALGNAALSALLDVTVGMFGVADGEVASLVALAVSAVLVVLLVVCEVRAYRALIAACVAREDEPEMSDKILLGAALWFVGGLPQCIVSLVREAAGVAAPLADPQTLLIQLGISLVLAFLAWGRFRSALRR